METDQCYPGLATKYLNPDGKLMKAMSIFRGKIHLFIQKCLLDAGFNVADVCESSDSYLTFVSIVLDSEEEFYEDLSDTLAGPKKKKHKKLQFSFDSKLDRALGLYARDYSTLLTDCMLTPGLKSDDIEFKNQKAKLVSLFGSETQKHHYISNKSSNWSNTSFSESMTFSGKNIHDHEAMQIYKSSHFTSYTYFDKSQKKIIKVANISDDIGNIGIDNELKLSKQCMHPGIRQSVKCLSFKSRDALLMNWFEGETIQNCGKFQTYEFLVIAREIASALVTLHSSRIIHTNLSTEHIIVNLESRSVNIISLRLAFNPDSENYHHDSQRNFKFISPEQCKTGLNRKIDFRSDLYSLGMIYYFMLAGCLPFESENYLSMMQLHWGQRVEPLNMVDTAIPRPISQLIMKLLEKSPDNRQQSSKAVIYDIDLMISEYNNGKALSTLNTEHGFLNEFYLPQKLHGRQAEFALLKSTFDKVCNGGFEIVTVTGSGGNGKTFFVEHLYEIVAQRKGFFIRGKYSQSLINEPYSALIKAIQSFCSIVLMGSLEMITHFKERIQLAVKDEGKILTDAISGLHLIIGEQPLIAPAIEAKNRFNYVFFKFVRAICSPQYPLVLLLDDTHWADSDSIELLTMLSSDKEAKYFFFICTYRNDETTFKIEVLNTISHCIELPDLDYDDVNTMISDTLKQSKSETFPLSAFVYEKTKGNMFFIVQMLLQFKEENVLQYSYDQCNWKWDTNCLKELSISNHVVPLLKKKLLKLSYDKLNFLKVLSCIDGQFSLSMLKIITDDAHLIQHTVIEGFIVPSSTSQIGYRFAHDYVQESVVSLIPEDERKATSLFIGKKLWDNSLLSERFQYLFIVTNLLNFSSELITDCSQIRNLAQLNFISGQTSKSSDAFQVSLKYFKTAIRLLKPNHWQEEYNFSLDLFNFTAEVAFCLSDYNTLNEMIDHILNNTVSSPIDKVHSCTLQIRSFCDQNMESKALNYGLHALECLGEKLELKQLTEIIPEIEQINFIISQDSFDAMSLAEDTNEYTLAVMKILSEMGRSVYFSKPEFLPALVTRMMQISLEYGFSNYSPFSFACFGAMNCIYLNRHKESIKYKTISLQLIENNFGKNVVPHTYFIIYTCLDFWSQHISSSIEALWKTYEIGQESGANDYASLAVTNHCGNAFVVGANLPALLERMDRIEYESVTPINFASTYIAVNTFMNSEIDEDSKRIINYKAGRFICCFHRMFEAYYFHEYERAAKLIEVAESVHFNIRAGTFNYQLFIFYRGLIAFAMVKNGNNESNWLDLAEDSISKMRLWSEIIAQNFENKLMLLEAEMASVRGDKTNAAKLFEQAINLSKRNSFINEEALANERAGIFYIDMDREDKSCKLFNQSIKLYSEWGAIAKVRHIMTVFSKFVDEKKLVMTSSSVNIFLDCTESLVESVITR